MPKRKAESGKRGGRARRKRARAAPLRGRPIEPGSLRQAGVMLRVRILPDDLARYEAAAAASGASVSGVVRGLLDGWERSGGGPV